MPEANNVLYIISILESIEKVFIYSEGYESPVEFLWSNDQLNFNATLNLLLAIGEESKKIDENLKINFPKIKWKEIEGLRNRIAHDYRGIDADIVWDIIQQYLNPLKEALIYMLKGTSFDKNILYEAINTDYYKHLKYLLEELQIK